MSKLPKDWIDTTTGHRIIRLTEELETQSLYFNYNCWTPSGDLILEGRNSIVKAKWANREWTSSINDNLETIITIDEPFRLLFTARTAPLAFYCTQENRGQRDGPKTIYVLNTDTYESRKLIHLPTGDIQSLNADDTLLAGIETPPHPKLASLQINRPRDPAFDQVDFQATWPDGTPMTYADAKEVVLDERLEARIPVVMFTIDVKTGERKDVMRSTDWLNHLLFSPTDPGLLMYCHEGPWHKVDRIWSVRVDTPDPRPMRIHNRTMNMEIAGHEWWSEDGKTIWYDLQTPRGEDFWVAGYELDTGKRTWYHLERNEWSVHFNTSRDGSLFAGDGADETMVARGTDAKWLYLFKPIITKDVAGIRAPNSASLIQAGKLEAEKLVDMGQHDYRFEPNIIFSPDGKWIIFRSNMHGEVHTYAVELKKSTL